MRRPARLGAVLTAAAIVAAAIAGTAAAREFAKAPAAGEAAGTLAAGEFAAAPAAGKAAGTSPAAKAAGASAAAAPAGASATAEPVAAGNVRNFLLDLDGNAYNWGTVAPQYQGIAVNAWDGAWLAQIHAASPGTKVYVYKSLIDTRSQDCGSNPGGGSPCIVGGTICPAGVQDAPDLASGIGFCWTWRNHRNWFLTGANGKLLPLAGYPDQYLMDFGLAAYQRTWLRNVAASTKAAGFQGVFADNAIITTGYGVPAKYPTDAAVQSAMSAMLARVGPALRADGFKVLANLGNNNVYPALWGNWLHYVSGFLNEFWGYWPGNSPQNGWYQWTTHEVKACVRHNKVCVFHGGDRSMPLSQAQQNYLTATLLLFTNGRQYLAYAGDSPPAPQVRLGAAAGPAHRTRAGLWRRRFACGSVTVRPAGDGTRGSGTVKITC
jgi:hypothetical protein